MCIERMVCGKEVDKDAIRQEREMEKRCEQGVAKGDEYRENDEYKENDMRR